MIQNKSHEDSSNLNECIKKLETKLEDNILNWKSSERSATVLSSPVEKLNNFQDKDLRSLKKEIKQFKSEIKNEINELKNLIKEKFG